MLYDHRESKAENINVVNKKEFLSIAAEMSQTLHSAYQKNIEGEWIKPNHYKLDLLSILNNIIKINLKIVY